MTAFETSIIIQAPAQDIWDLLTDASGWTSWNTTVQRLDGNIALGEEVTVYAKINPGSAFPVKVSEFTPPTRMVWSNRMSLGLIKGVRTYQLSEQGDGKTEFRMREEYSGLFSGAMTRSMPDLQPSFDEFAMALKSRAEKHR